MVLRFILYAVLFPSLAFSQHRELREDTVRARTFYTLAETLREAAYYDSALSYYVLAEPLYEKHAIWPMYLECKNGVGGCLTYQGFLDKAEETFKHALAVGIEKLGETNTQTADSYNMLGITYYYKNEPDKTLEYFIKALNISIKIFGENNGRVAKSYNNIAIIYSDRRDFDQSLTYHKKALKIRKELFGEDHFDIAQSLDNMGVVYSDIGEDSMAMECHMRALEIKKNVLGNDHPEVAYSYTNIGYIHDKNGRKEQALAFYKKDLAIMLKRLGEKNREVVVSYNNIGSIYDALHYYDTALLYFQKALISNVKSFNDSNLEANPPLAEIADPKELLRTLYLKAEVSFTRDTANYSNNLLSYQTYLLCDSLIDKLQQTSDNEADKIETARLAKKALNWSPWLCWQLAKKAPSHELKTHFTGKVFYFVEKLKASVLTQSLAEVAAKQFAGIPDSLLTREQFLKENIIAAQQSLADESLTADQRPALQDEVFNLNTKLNNLIKDFEKHYPNYYALKYNHQVVSLADIQKMLDKKTLLLSYTLTSDTTVTVLAITAKGIHTEFVETPINISKYATAFRNAILLKSKETFQQSGYALYKALFPKAIDLKGIKNIIIIPDEILTSVPFEALPQEDLSQPKYSKASHTEYPFLIKKYVISYAYSANLLFQQMMASRASGSTKSKTQYDFLGLAPIFQGKNNKNIHHKTRALLKKTENVYNAEKTRGRIFTGDEISPLPATEHEVKTIFGLHNQKSLKAELLLGDAAKEEVLKSGNLKNFRYVHIATHGFVNEDTPQFSGILFAQDSTSAEDGILYSAEIYNLKFEAALVTLSACETGLGKIAQGEGIIGLNRALLYAGANNMVLSLWKVADESTADLMISFYKNILMLKYPTTFATSLRKAKLELVKKKDVSDPYYWSPFILIGK